MTNSDTSDMFEGLNDIINKRNSLNYNLVTYIEKLKTPIERSNKKIIWGKIIDIFLNMVDTLSEGYKTIDIGDNKMIMFGIEKNNQCSITSCSPPYIKIYMNCGHDLSLMALCGIIINGSSDDTESIKCPLCRADLYPKLIPASPDDEYKKSKLKYYSKKYLLNNKPKPKIDLANYETKNNKHISYINGMSTEAKEYIKSIYDKDNESKFCMCKKKNEINSSEETTNDDILFESSYKINLPRDIRTLEDKDTDTETFDDSVSSDTNQDEN
jgi:hypothetical protein